MIGYATGYRIGTWIVEQIPERAIAWLAHKPQVVAWARKGSPDA